MQGAKSKPDLSTSSAVCWILIRALQESFWFVSWLLVNKAVRFTFRSNRNILLKPRRPSVSLSYSKMHYAGLLHNICKFFLLGLHFLTHLQFLKQFANLSSHSPTSLRIHQPRLHSAKLRADRNYEQKSDGQVLRAVVQYLIWPHIYCSVLQFTVHSINSKGKLWREMWWKLHSVLVATKSSLPNTLKGNCNIWRVI